jgi:hypothetical protein
MKGHSSEPRFRKMSAISHGRSRSPQLPWLAITGRPPCSTCGAPFGTSHPKVRPSKHRPQALVHIEAREGKRRVCSSPSEDRHCSTLKNNHAFWVRERYVIGVLGFPITPTDQPRDPMLLAAGLARTRRYAAQVSDLALDARGGGPPSDVSQGSRHCR